MNRWNRLALLGAGLAVTLAGAVGSAHALAGANVNVNPGQVTFDDTGVTPAGAQLRATLTLNFIGSGLDVTVVTGGSFNSTLSTRFSNGSIQFNTANGNNVNNGDLLHIPPFFTTAVANAGTVDDL
ncbi:MAG: hypothetical protein JWN04_6265 [Myxococcaceae bacterium]|nr:hypothetical protein [Myxococcaceae bacterium]